MRLSKHTESAFGLYQTPFDIKPALVSLINKNIFLEIFNTYGGSILFIDTYINFIIVIKVVRTFIKKVVSIMQGMP